MDGAPPNDGGATLIELTGAKNAIVQNNVLDTIATAPMQTLRCGSQTYFDNRTVAGGLVTPPGIATDGFRETLDIPSDDAFVLSCFHHY